MTGEKKHRRLLLRVLSGLLAAGILVIGALLGVICIGEGRVFRDVAETQRDYDAVIVLGAQVKPDGIPSVQLAWRLDAAAQAWREKQVPVVVCGAQGKDEPEPEAETMKRYLTETGIPGNMILSDPDSFNTQENLRNAMKLLDVYPGTIRKVLVVTSDYHVPRALSMARDLGLEAEGLGSPCLPEYWLKNHAREVLAWGKYLLNKYLHLNL